MHMVIMCPICMHMSHTCARFCNTFYVVLRFCTISLRIENGLSGGSTAKHGLSSSPSPGERGKARFCDFLPGPFPRERGKARFCDFSPRPLPSPFPDICDFVPGLSPASPQLGFLHIYDGLEQQKKAKNM